MRGLKNKVVVITGGLGDLGYATAQRMYEEGCKVVVFDILEEDKGRLSSVDAAYFKIDITNEKQIEEACCAIKKEIGPINILINAAACFIFKGVEATPEDWAKICSVNIAGTSSVTKFAVQHMKEIGGGTIVNFSSISGFIAQANFSTYNATKFAIRGLTRCWAKDLAPLNIRVNSICPGYIYTSAFIDSCKKLGMDVEEEDKRASALNLLNRQGRPEEVASTVAFLASDDASYITGSDLLVDGGYLAI